jgi:hypothetical protein
MHGATTALLLLLLSTWSLATRNACAEEKDKPQLDWHQISAHDIQGKGWADTERPFDRLPARAKSIVREPVRDLAKHSAGIYVDFTTNAESISARWSVASDRLAMPHMPATGVSGVDLYLHRAGDWHYLGTGRPLAQTTTQKLTSGLKPEEAEYRVYFPLYNGLKSLEVGLPQGASFKVIRIATTKSDPIIFYGTSITQGGCASRPGMSYPSLVGRHMNMPAINLGFSGNGKAEPEVAKLLGELKARAFVLDPLPNLFPEDVAERLPKFVEILRETHPKTPILLVESPLFPDSPFAKDRAERVALSNRHVRSTHDERVAAGDKNIWVVSAFDFTQNGGEYTVDGVHPTDVGFLKQAAELETVLKQALNIANDAHRGDDDPR